MIHGPLPTTAQVMLHPPSRLWSPRLDRLSRNEAPAAETIESSLRTGTLAPLSSPLPPFTR